MWPRVKEREKRDDDDDGDGDALERAICNDGRPPPNPLICGSDSAGGEPTALSPHCQPRPRIAFQYAQERIRSSAPRPPLPFLQVAKRENNKKKKSSCGDGPQSEIC